ncbi:MAG: pilus assembly protein PilM [Coraliomargaritaceae bacterium]
MSQSNRLIIKCGASSVTAAVLSASGGGIRLEQVFTEKLRYDISDEDAWVDATGVALKEMSRANKLSGAATFILPGSQVLTRPIRIPYVDPAKRAQTVAFEAQQNIPFQLHEVVWDNQEVSDDGVETEVLFVASKAVLINDFCNAVAAAGLTAERIDASTLLDYNSAQYTEKGAEVDTLVINIGARSTNLLFINDGGFFIRNIQIGGNTLTQSIADSLGKSFSQAEEIKHRFYSGENGYSEDDSGSRLLQTSEEAFSRRLNQEITRSIVNYRRQQKAPAPTRILLTGYGAQLKGLSDRLSTAQKVPVEFFDPLSSVELGPAVAASPELSLQLGEIIGEATRDLVPSGAGVNLLPAQIQEQMAFSKKKPFLVAAAACLALAPLPVFLSFSAGASAAKEQLSAVEDAINPLVQRQAAIESNREQALVLGEAIAGVEELVHSKSNWIEFFADLQEMLYKAEDVWVDDLKVTRSVSADGGEAAYQLGVSGQMLVRESAQGERVDQDVLVNRIRSLQSSLENSRFVVEAKSPKISWNTLKEGLNVLPFNINLVVDPAKPL